MERLNFNFEAPIEEEQTFENDVEQLEEVQQELDRVFSKCTADRKVEIIDQVLLIHHTDKPRPMAKRNPENVEERCYAVLESMFFRFNLQKAEQKKILVDLRGSYELQGAKIREAEQIKFNKQQ